MQNCSWAPLAWNGHVCGGEGAHEEYRLLRVLARGAHMTAWTTRISWFYARAGGTFESRGRLGAFATRCKSVARLSCLLPPLPICFPSFSIPHHCFSSLIYYSTTRSLLRGFPLSNSRNSTILRLFEASSSFIDFSPFRVRNFGFRTLFCYFGSVSRNFGLEQLLVVHSYLRACRVHFSVTFPATPLHHDGVTIAHFCRNSCRRFWLFSVLGFGQTDRARIEKVEVLNFEATRGVRVWSNSSLLLFCLLWVLRLNVLGNTFFCHF